MSVVGSSKSAFNSNNRATSAALPAAAARYIFVRPRSSQALMLAGVAVVVVAIESVRTAQVCFVWFWPEKKNENETGRKERNQAKSNVYLKERNEKNKREPQNPHFVLASCCAATDALAEKQQSKRKNVCFQSRRCA